MGHSGDGAERPRRRRELVAALVGSSALLIVDNCEHLIERRGEPLVDMLLAGCPKLRIIATSGSPLTITGGRCTMSRRWPLPDPDAPALRSARCGCCRAGRRARAGLRDRGLESRVVRDLPATGRHAAGDQLAAARVRALTPDRSWRPGSTIDSGC